MKMGASAFPAQSGKLRRQGAWQETIFKLQWDEEPLSALSDLKTLSHLAETSCCLTIPIYSRQQASCGKQHRTLPFNYIAPNINMTTR